MQFVGRVFSSVSDFYTGINPSTLSGAVDIIVVEDQDTKMLTSSPFHVRFGKFQVLRPQDRVVELEINGGRCEGVRMKVGEAGEAFFVEEISMTPPDAIDQDLLTSPLPQPMGQAIPVAEMEKLSLIKSDDEHANALSDSELDTRPVAEEEPIQRTPKAELPASSPPRYFWNWGSLPTKNEKEKVTEEKGEEREEKEKERNTALALEKDPAADNRDASARDAVDNFVKRSHSQSPVSRGLADVLPTQFTTLSEWLAKQEMTPLIDLLSTQIPIHIDIVSVKGDQRMADWKERLEADLANLESSLVLQRVPMELAIADEGAFLRKDECIYAIKMPDSTILWVTGKLGWTVWMAWKLGVGKAPTKDQLSSAIAVAVKEPEPVKAVNAGGWWWSRQQAREKAKEAAKEIANKDIAKVTAKEAAKDKDEQTSPILGPQASPVSSSTKKYRKSLRLSSEQLRSLGLNPGLNTIAFTIPSTSAKCQARIFLWPSTASIVVSDIDGTITKSDALGHLFTMVGRDWTHVGVAKLYTEVARNGYRLMYLTSRAIGQAQSTRTYLKGVEQDKYQLPDGPVIMSPDRFFAAVRRELIEGNPESFKIAALLDVARLFCEGEEVPFYAGFGNRSNDALAYRAVGIPASRIFTINPSGDLSLELIGQYYSARSYERLTDLVDQLFPPLPSDNVAAEVTAALSPQTSSTSSISLHRRTSILSPPRQAASDEPYNDFFYWRRGLTGVLPTSATNAKPLSPLNSEVPASASVVTGEVDADEEDEEELAEEEEGLIPYV